MSTPTRYGASRAELASIMTEWEEPRYRVDQLWQALYAQRRPIEDATALPVALRTRVGEAFPLALDHRVTSTGDAGTTHKYLWRTRDGHDLETVLMQYSGRATVCISSQAGCAMGCTFCATGQAGFDRHLDVGEILEQVVRAEQRSGTSIDNVVFMGMGEPLSNYDAVWESVRRIHDDLGVSARRITVSTVGIVPGIRRLADQDLRVTLAVSLHAATDELRDELVPVNRRYPLAAVLDAIAEHQRATGRRASIEYAAISGVNDTFDQARELARRLVGIGPPRPHVNVIPLNPTVGYREHPSDPRRLRAFAGALRTEGVTATIRRNRGTDIDAACGQLRARHPASPTPAVLASAPEGHNGGPAEHSNGPESS